MAHEIEANQVKVHAEQVDKTVELVGSLQEKRMEERDKIEVTGIYPLGGAEADAGANTGVRVVSRVPQVPQKRRSLLQMRYRNLRCREAP